MAVKLNGQQDVYPLTSHRESVILARVRDSEAVIRQNGQPGTNGRNPKTPTNWVLANLQDVTPIGKTLPLPNAKPKRPHVTGPLPIRCWTVCGDQLKASLTVGAVPSELAYSIERFALVREGGLVGFPKALLRPR
jgi:hypothetical protein